MKEDHPAMLAWRSHQKAIGYSRPTALPDEFVIAWNAAIEAAKAKAGEFCATGKGGPKTRDMTIRAIDKLKA